MAGLPIDKFRKKGRIRKSPFGNRLSTNTRFRQESSIDSDVGACGEVDSILVCKKYKIFGGDRVSC